MGRTSCGVARRTRPAPPRRAARAESTAAPDMPRLPATTRTRPKVPLLLSAERGGRVGGWATSLGAGVVLMARWFPSGKGTGKYIDRPVGDTPPTEVPGEH